ncbi:MAG: hypothetical protein AAF389_20655 [Gemmatimonadota bacterium]
MTLVRWIVAAAVSAAGGVVALNAPADRTVVGSSPPPVSAHERVAERRSVDSLWLSAPFRLGRQIPPRYRPAEEVDFAEPEEAVRPEWRLTGIVRGEEPVALIEGVGGRGEAARMVQVGDPVGDWTVLWIAGDTAVIGDGVVRWTYSIEAPWGGGR